MTPTLIPPPGVAALCARLAAAGFAAYPVGGGVRDLLLGRPPEDWDVATAAPPERILSLFPGGAATGGVHGTVTVPTLSGGSKTVAAPVLKVFQS